MRKSFLSATLAILFAGAAIPAYATNLVEAYKDAVQNDPQTLKAKAAYDASVQAEEIAFSSLLPSVSLTAGYTTGTSEQVSDAGAIYDVDSNTTSWGVTLSQTIFKMGDWYNLDAAEQRALRSQTDFDFAQQGLIQRVANAYFNVLKAQDTLEFAQAERKAIERQLEQTKERFKVGLTARTDVHEAQANFDNAVATEIRSQNDVEIAKEGLREITGKFYADVNVLNTERFDAQKPSPADVNAWVKKAEENSLELKAKELLVQAAKFDIKRSEAGHYPTLDLTASIGGKKAGGDIEGPNLNSSSIGVNLTVPIYTGGGTSAAIKQAQANYVLASEDREATYRSVVRTVRTSYADVVSLVSTLKALEQSVISAESALQATQAGFEVGTRTIVDVLNSTRNLYNAKRNLSNSRYNYILAMMSLKQAAGELSAQDLVAVNSGLK